jgi:hypothetical protein
MRLKQSLAFEFPRAVLMAMMTFEPDLVEAELRSSIETALFLGVRGNPPLESTQLRWPVKVGPHESVLLQSGAHLGQLGGALFLTTKEPRPEVAPGETPAPIGWMKWIAEQGRRSFQIQLAISRVGFDRVCGLAEQGRYPHAILTFEEEAGIDDGIWKNVESSVALIREFTLRYDFGAIDDAPPMGAPEGRLSP